MYSPIWLRWEARRKILDRRKVLGLQKAPVAQMCPAYGPFSKASNYMAMQVLRSKAHRASLLSRSSIRWRKSIPLLFSTLPYQAITSRGAACFPSPTDCRLSRWLIRQWSHTWSVLSGPQWFPIRAIPWSSSIMARKTASRRLVLLQAKMARVRSPPKRQSYSRLSPRIRILVSRSIW